MRFLAFYSIIALYFTAACYSGYAILRLFNKTAFSWHTAFFWLLWLCMAIAPLAVTFGRSYLVKNNLEWLMPPGHYWLVFIYYFTVVLLAVDLLLFVHKKFLLFDGILAEPRRLIAYALVFIGLVLAYGTYCAQNTVVRHYDVTIPKISGTITSIRAVLVADVHLGFIVDETRLGKMVNMINDLQPDIIFLAGDITEDGPKSFQKRNMADTLRKLDAPLGAYLVLGNHEYIAGPVEENIRAFESAGISVLRDEYTKIANSFYLVGRDDFGKLRFAGERRRDLADVMQGIDHSFPIILLDHQPFFLNEARDEKVDLQLSGHTHRGQFFPNNFVTAALFENDWGYLKTENLQTIVTSGFGTWGPPVRVGSVSEIVCIDIKFNN
jgi:predicted MPP superfamily phosphohydrolase